MDYCTNCGKHYRASAELEYPGQDICSNCGGALAPLPLVGDTMTVMTDGTPVEVKTEIIRAQVRNVSEDKGPFMALKLLMHLRPDLSHADAKKIVEEWCADLTKRTAAK